MELQGEGVSLCLEKMKSEVRMAPHIDRTIRYVLARAGERSTWRGVIGLVTALGVVVEPTKVAAIVTIAVGVASIMEMMLPDPPAGGTGDGK